MTALSRWRTRRAALFFVAVLLLAMPAGPARAQPAAMVQVDPVIVEPLMRTAPVLGRVVARDAVLATQVSGTVEVVHRIIGDHVEKGELIAELDSARLEAEVDLARAERDAAVADIEAAEAALALARTALERTRGLRGSAAFSQQRLDETEQELRRQQALREAAQARLLRAESSLALAEIDLADARLHAPFAGTIIERDAHVGEYLQIGDPVVTVVNDHDLEIEAAVPTERVAGLRPGVRVEFRLDDGSRHEAEVRAVLPLENPRSRTRAVRFEPFFGETTKPIAGEQSLTVRVPVGQPRDIVTVHKDALLSRPDGTSVFVVEDGMATPRPVTVGEAVGNRFEVVDGLAPGERVVIRGNERLRPGQAVETDGSA